VIDTPPGVSDAHSDRPTLIATRGLPGSGKTTWARDRLARSASGNLARCNRDDLRRMLWGAPRYDRESEAVITMVQHDIVAMLLRTGRTVIVDDTNLVDTHVGTLQLLASIHDADWHVEDFRDVPLQLCIDRDSQRGADRVGEQVIRRMHDTHLAPTPLTAECAEPGQGR